MSKAVLILIKHSCNGDWNEHDLRDSDTISFTWQNLSNYFRSRKKVSLGLNLRNVVSVLIHRFFFVLSIVIWHAVRNEVLDQDKRLLTK